MFQDYPSKNHRVCLSFGIEKAILSVMHEDTTPEQFEEIVLSSYELVYPKPLTQKLKPQIIGRVLARIEEQQSKEASIENSKHKKSFGTSFADWLANLSATESCLYLADYDIEKALKYYWEEDLLLVQEAIKVKSARESQNALIQLEACMYGFGNPYSDDSTKTDTNTINLDNMDPSDIQGMLGGFGL